MTTAPPVIRVLPGARAQAGDAVSGGCRHRTPVRPSVPVPGGEEDNPRGARASFGPAYPRRRHAARKWEVRMASVMQLAEHWILHGDTTNSTQFFWLLTKAIERDPALFSRATSAYCTHMEDLFRTAEQLAQTDLPFSRIANTMGDGFFLLGRPGRGSRHITDEASDLLIASRKVKETGDRILASLRDECVGWYPSVTDEAFPSLELKIVLHQGHLASARLSGHFVGDTVNYCSRVAASAFDDGRTDRIVFTDSLFEVLPEDIKERTRRYGRPVPVKNYPKKDGPHCPLRPREVYGVPLSDDDFWTALG
ncbi:MAG: hypothetical protein ABII00_00615 [Elusimicrobiota bacterium]